MDDFATAVEIQNFLGSANSISKTSRKKNRKRKSTLKEIFGFNPY